MAKNLIEKYLQNELNDSEKEELANWVKSNQKNNHYFSQLKNIWLFSGINKTDNNIDLEKEFEIIKLKLGDAENHNKPRYKLYKQNKYSKTIINYILKVAAFVLLFYSIGLTILHINDKKTEYNEVTTRRGEKSQLVLSDGTTIWLNSETKIKYPSRLKSNNINIYLDGEAYFNVTKKKNRKYIINTSMLNIEVLGTCFNVKSYPDEDIIETTLEKGSVLINPNKKQGKSNQSIILNPNQKATFIKNSEKINITKISSPDKSSNQEPHKIELKEKVTIKPRLIVSKQIDTELYTSWKDGRMVFRKESFFNLSKKMERWYDVQIIILDDELKDWKYTGIFEKETIEQALEALSMSMSFQYTIEQNLITINK